MAPLRFVVFIGLGLPLAALAAPPPSIGYAQSSGYYEQEKKPALYTPLNLLDGRDSTAWCATGTGTGPEKLSFGFKGPVSIDAVRVYTGNGTEPKSFKDFARAKKLTLTSNHGARTLTVADQHGEQVVPLKPALAGAEFVLEITEQAPGEDPTNPVCLTDVIFYSEGKPLNGPWLTPKLKYDKPRAAVLGTWFSGFESAPERFLSLYFDRTYRFVYEPIDPTAEGHTLSGDYEVAGDKVTLSVPGKGKLVGKLSPRKDGEARALTFEGAPEDFKGPFRDRK